MRRFLKIFTIILALFLITFLALPTLVSLKAVQPTLINQINKKIPGHVTVKSYSLSWFGGITIEDFKLSDPKGALVLDFERFETDTSLFSLLYNKKLSKNTKIKALNANIVVTPSGKTNLEESLGSHPFFAMLTPLRISRLDIDLIPDEHLSGTFMIESLVIPQEWGDHTLSDLKIEWAYNGIFNATLAGKMAQDGEIHGDITYNEIEDSVQATLMGKNIPSKIVELASGADYFIPVFGSSIDSNIAVDIVKTAGTVQVKLNGQKGKLDLNGSVAKGILTLNSPFYVETEPSETLAKDLLKKYSPIMGELRSGDSRISLTVSPDGFSLPIFDFDLSTLKIGQAKVELGKLYFNNKGDLKKAAKFLNAPSSDQVSIWFTPQYFSFLDGELNVQRTDFLLMDHYPFAVWGSVNLLRNSVDATIGISGLALAKAYKLKGMGEGSFLQVPLRGKIDKLKVDTATVSTRVATLLVKQQGGPEGMLLGTVMDIAQGGQQSVMPVATTNPLPWSGKLDTSKDTTSNASIESAAKEVLKGLFK